MKTYRRDFIKTLGIGFIGTGLGLSLSEKLLAEAVVQSGEITANTKNGKIRGTLLNQVGVFRESHMPDHQMALTGSCHLPRLFRGPE